jgi:hypothetical protein
MKRKSSRYRAVPFSARILRPFENLDLSLFRLPSSSKQPGLRARRIFVVKQVQRLPATTAAGRKIERILIFDNDPNSLRLVFGRRADSQVELSDSQPVFSLGVALLWILVVGLMAAMFWPIL